MKITLRPLVGGDYPPYSEIKALLKKDAKVVESKPFPREAGGGVWVAYGLEILFSASCIIAAGFLQKLGSDLYSNLKKRVKRYVVKDPVFFVFENYDKKENLMIISFLLGEEGESSFPKRIGYVDTAMDKLPEAMKNVGNFVYRHLVSYLPSGTTVIECKYYERDQNWHIDRVSTYS